jgi:hypothetical protein
MLLQELFHPSTNVKVSRYDDNPLGGASYAVVIKANDEFFEYSVIFTATPIRGFFHISFALVGDAAGEQQWTHDVTNTGQAFHVFAGVAAALKDWLQSTKGVYALYFTAKESSRSKLYHKFALRIAKHLGWNLDQELARIYSGGDSDEYTAYLILDPKHHHKMSKEIKSLSLAEDAVLEKKNKKSNDKIIKKFKVDKNDEVVVIFKKLDFGENDWEVAFERMSPFTGKMTTTVTSSGHAHRIFRRVLVIIKDFITGVKPDSLWIWSLERDSSDSRTKLYDHMLDKLPPKVDYQLTDRANFGGSVVWVIKPMKQPEIVI